MISSASASNAKSPSGSAAISRHRRRRSRRTRSRWPLRPICRRSRSSMTVKLTGRPSARRSWWAPVFLPAGCVPGKPLARSAAPDLLAVVGRALINGVEVGQGTGADVLGHPHNALAWLPNHLAADGKGLRAGEIVLTGSLVKTVWLNAGDKVVMELEGLGRVEATFA